MNTKKLVGEFFMEQENRGFSINVAISNLRGSGDVQWTNCYNRTCRKLTDEFAMKECKLDCQWRAINLLVSRMVSLRAECRKTVNRDVCMKTLGDTMLNERMKQRKIRDEIANVRRQREEAKRTQAAGQKQQGAVA